MSFGTTMVWAAASLAIGIAAATAARSFRSLARTELEEVCRRRRCEHLIREILLGYQQAALGAECLQTICNAVFVAALVSGVVSWTFTAEWAGVWQFAVAALIGAAGLLVANVWAPEAVARVGSTSYAVATWPVWRFVSRLLFPLVFAAQRANRLVERLSGRMPPTLAEISIDDDIRAIVSEGQRDGPLEVEAREMIEGVIQLGDAEVAQVMTPRTYMFSMRASLSLDEAVKFVIAAGHTRIPVFDKNRDDIIGILHMKDLLPELMKGSEDRAANVVDLLRPAHFVPETKRLDELLQEFQQTRNHMAVVLDEYGGVSGVVTLEDVLEEIVGEIVDEYDDDLIEGIKSIDDRTAEVLARVHINEINERLGIHLPEDGEFDTIGGFVFSHLGHIPAVGETVTVDDVRLTVMDVTRRRIERVRVEVLDHSRA